MAATVKEKRKITYCKAPLPPRVKKGRRTVVSETLVKQGVTNLTPKLHVKRGDIVMLMAGSKQTGRGKTGKVLSVLPSKGKVIVEGINVVSKATRARTAMGKGGLIKREAPIFASRVMLFCTQCKNPTRIKHKVLDNGKKGRVCKKCGEVFSN